MLNTPLIYTIHTESIENNNKNNSDVVLNVLIGRPIDFVCIFCTNGKTINTTRVLYNDLRA